MSILVPPVAIVGWFAAVTIILAVNLLAEAGGLISRLWNGPRRYRRKYTRYSYGKREPQNEDGPPLGA
ncbi:hypothetical protein [Sphingomonas koreensis]